ncbi:predicted protein [Nematostella vectensis]|uniref:E3 ubiquitin-protein ligase Msl2 zinc RING finger domain-containing protein n=1 Tax=Nematostella vectensis TaxID=45351 RepID=A7SED6_NEMVE|nr:predicted protein [Nematostella vectensis]|eukprot:XP_001629972.1 predicted protein [Nematostella vectensis]
MNATTLYVEACKCMLYFNSENPSKWDDLLQLLPRLRQSLSCRVCRGLVVDPFGSQSCLHYVCRGCLRKKRALNPGCRWCLNLDKLVEDRQTKIVLACYRKLCEFLTESTVVKCASTLNGECNTTLALLHEALANPVSIEERVGNQRPQVKRILDQSSSAETPGQTNKKMAPASCDLQAKLPAEVAQIPKKKIYELISELDGRIDQGKEGKFKKKRKHFKGAIYNYNKKKKLKKLGDSNHLSDVMAHEGIVETVQMIKNGQETNDDIQIVEDCDDSNVFLEMESKKARKQCRCGLSSVGSRQKCVVHFLTQRTNQPKIEVTRMKGIQK